MDLQAQLMLAAQYGWGPGPESGQPGGTIQVQITLQVFFHGLCQIDESFFLHFYWVYAKTKYYTCVMIYSKNLEGKYRMDDQVCIKVWCC